MGTGLQIARWLLLFPLLAWATVVDFRSQRIPNLCVAIGLAGALLLAGAEAVLAPSFGPLLAWGLGALAGGLPLLAVAVLSRGGMGGGDVKLLAMVGAFVGAKSVLAVLFCAVVLGGVLALGLVLFGKKSLKTRVAFGPFIALATGLVVVFHEQIAIFLAVYYYVDF
jgi:leader peptidase (prepilin peptidase)/N-methyltransferase